MRENEKLPLEAIELKTQILNELSKSRHDYDVLENYKNKFMEIFAQEFQLGIPTHKLPENVLITDSFCVYLSYKLEGRNSANMEFKSLSFKNDDHIRNFYEVFELENGDHFAFCSARVSMPYMNRLDLNVMKEIKSSAEDYGIDCTFHSAWSWHWPNRSGLVLFKPITPTSVKKELFLKSFRKWVMEKQTQFLAEKGSPKLLQYAIEDVCRDETFPLDIKSYEDLIARYPSYLTHADKGWLKNFQYLMNKWSV